MTPAAMPPQCHIEAVETNGIVRLEAVLDARGALTGRYTLVVRSGAPRNVNTTQQGGEFAAGELDKGRLSTVYVSTGAAGWKAELKIFSDSGKLLCAISKP